jgi:hypothetical protein
MPTRQVRVLPMLLPNVCILTKYLFPTIISRILSRLHCLRVDRDRHQASEPETPSSSAAPSSTRTFISAPVAATEPVAQLPTPRSSSSPVPPASSETEAGSANGRERRARKSVNYAEPKLNTSVSPSTLNFQPQIERLYTEKCGNPIHHQGLHPQESEHQFQSLHMCRRHNQKATLTSLLLDLLSSMNPCPMLSIIVPHLLPQYHQRYLLLLSPLGRLQAPIRPPLLQSNEKSLVPMPYPTTTKAMGCKLMWMLSIALEGGMSG